VIWRVVVGSELGETTVSIEILLQLPFFFGGGGGGGGYFRNLTCKWEPIPLFQFDFACVRHSESMFLLLLLI
jgi:hypothetical protein